MKKTLVTLTVAAFVFGALTLAGCAKKKAEEAAPAPESGATMDTTAAPAEAAPADTSMAAPADTAAAH